jgi:predicted Zn finger-like uncharacterized protein
MLIVCPSCASQYELDAAKLGPVGRKVRCAACKTLWHVEPEPELPAAPSEDETRALLQEEIERAAVIDEQVTAVAAEQHVPAAEAPEPAPPPKPPRRRGGKLRKAAAGTRTKRVQRLAVAAALGGLALLGLLLWQREAVVRTAPQLAGLFETLGMPVNIRGLSLGAVESGVVDDGLGRFLVVEGDITNIGKRDMPVPPIEVAVRDAAGQTLYTWSTTPPKAVLEPAELVRFRARLATPPEAGRTVQVRFGTAKPAGIASAH